MKIARRIENLPPYLFVTISKKIAEKRSRGEEVISFGIGDPDLPTPKNVIEKLCQAAHDPANHRYPESEGMPELPPEAHALKRQTNSGIPPGCRNVGTTFMAGQDRRRYA